MKKVKLQPEELNRAIKNYAFQLGADLAGIADLAGVQGLETVPESLLKPFTRAVVIAQQLSPEVFAQMEKEPTALYAHQYAAVNQCLDHMILRLQSRLLNAGYRAMAIPASQTVDRQRWLGHVSTKALARVAGLGWQGKSLLLVTPQYGPRVRLACLLTDAPLLADAALPNRCGSCTGCQQACPASAIRGAAWEEHPATREEAVDMKKCVAHLRSIAQQQGREAYICGICIKACPWGKQKK